MSPTESIITLQDIAQALDAELLNAHDSSCRVLSVVTGGEHSSAESLFVAYNGVAVDGHDFIEQAFRNGSIAAVVTDRSKLGTRPGLLVSNSRKALSRLSALFFEEPSRELLSIGITGTNGKSTIHWILHQMLERLGYPGVRIGTLGVFAENVLDKPGIVTTPPSLEIQETLSLVRQHALRSCVMEVSSHALDQHRVDDVLFDVGIFTNLTRDHLDYHGTMEEYFQAKKRLFEIVLEGRREKGQQAGGAIINLDGDYCRDMLEVVQCTDLPVFTYGAQTEAQCYVKRFQQTLAGSTLITQYQRKEHKIHSGYIGAHNAGNLTAAFAACVSLGFGPEEVQQSMQDLPGVPGRMEPVGTTDFPVFVDYAHTPDAVSSALSALRDLVVGKLWVIVGCGGDRDRGKRALMGEAAAHGADKVVVTSDNPRTEDPERIISDILSTGIQPALVEVDRRQAIRRTLELVEPGDVVIVAGKGHEDYQIIGKTKQHFSDQEEVRRSISEGVFHRGPSTQKLVNV